MLAVVSVLVVLAGPSPRSDAHTPHDDVFGVAASPSFATDGTAIAVARGIAYRTTDGGTTWDRLVVGLTNLEPLTSIAVTCCEDATYLVASPTDGIFRSDDGGDTFSSADEGLGDRSVLDLVASPDRPGVAYALTDAGILATGDAGSSWAPLDGPEGEPTALGLVPGAADELLVGGADGTVHRSDDGGATWSTGEVGGSGAVRALARTGPEALLVGTDEGLLRTDDDLGSFEPVEVEGAGQQAVSAIAVAPDAVWVSFADDGTWRSDDGGETWTAVTRGLTRSTQADAPGYEDRPHFGEVVIAPAADGEEPTVLLAAFAGLFVLDPGASSWREAELMGSRIVVGLAVSPDYATDGTVAVTTYMNGASRSTDGGDSWEPINDGLTEEVLYASADDRFARLFGIALSPDFADDQTMVVARWTDAVASDDAGTSWTEVAVLPGDDPPLQQFALAFAPGREPGTTVVLTGSRDGGVHRSLDGGRSYEEVGAVDGQVRSIVAVPGQPGAFWAATQRGAFASADEGATWTTVTTDVRDAVNLAMSPAFADDGVAFAATRRGLWATRDGGATWVRAEDPAGLRSGFVEGVAVSPAFADDGIVLASVRGRGLLRSTDGGVSFSPIATDLAARQLELSNFPNATAVPLVFSPAFDVDRTVFGFSGDDVLRSTDGGETWEVLDVPVATHEPVPDGGAGGASSADGERSPGSGSPESSRPASATVAAAGAVVLLVAGGIAVLVRRRRRRRASA